MSATSDAEPRLERDRDRVALSPADEAWQLITRLFLEQKERMSATAAEMGLSIPVVMAFTRLDPADPRPMSELADAMRCDASYITSIVDRLEDRGYVERRPAAHDRRVKELAVTEAGAAARDRAMAPLREAPEPFHALAERDQRALRDILLRVLEPEDARAS